MADPLFVLLGLKSSHAVGGIAGGTVRHILLGGGWLKGVASVLAGLLCAVNLTPPSYFMAVYYFPQWADPSIELGICFLVGLTGLLLCDGFILLASRWSKDPKLPL